MKEIGESARTALDLEAGRQGIFGIAYTTLDAPDGASLVVIFKGGQTFHWWPKTGWWNRVGAKGQGRGLPHLFENAAKVPNKPRPAVPASGYKSLSTDTCITDMTDFDNLPFIEQVRERQKAFWMGLGIGFAIGASLKLFLDSL